MSAAQRRGHAVNEPVLAELTKWVAGSGDGKFGMARPASAPKALSPKAVWFVLALGAIPKPDTASQEGMKLLLKTRQNADGGWSQTKDMASDAWVTGQALYAIAHAGIKSHGAVIARAHAFLIQTQRPDGSRPMTSRPTKPGGEGSGNLIPITGAGSAWAVLGLVSSR
jgi:hypothetical protein